MANTNYRVSRIAQSMVVLFVLVVLIAAAGILLIFKLTFSRQVQSYGVVVDAGSTQTRSSLFKISWREPIDADIQMSDLRPNDTFDLSRILSIEQVSTCVNGGPISSIRGVQDSAKLFSNCLMQFINDIQIDMRISSEKQSLEGDDNAPSQSVSHIFLGATAGMRAIETLDPNRAEDILYNIRRSMHLYGFDTVYNLGTVDIITGPQEALYGWLSANYMCHRLTIAPSSTKTTLTTNDNSQANERQDILQETNVNSIGTIELGGASAQMAYQVSIPLSKPIKDESNTTGTVKSDLLDTDDQNLFTTNLFDNQYQVRARSDLCLGMSQAALRTNIVIIYDYLLNNRTLLDSTVRGRLIVDNPCLQRNSNVSFSESLFNKLSNPCLKESHEASSNLGPSWDNLKQDVVTFRGTGEPDKCSTIVAKLLYVEACKRYFLLCPHAQPRWPPPPNVPFVTISGYNKALSVLPMAPLRKHPLYEKTTNNYKQNQLVIEQQLGGYSIDYVQFKEETDKYCSIDVTEFPQRFPKMNRLFYSTNCFQLAYINKLLIEFYKFDPNSSWYQIKFLIFNPAPTTETKSTASNSIGSSIDREQHEGPVDIGWSLGLLINATNSHVIGATHARPGTIRLHHGISLLNVVRSGIFFLFLVSLLTFAIIVMAIIIIHNKRVASPGSVYTSTYHRDPSLFAYSL